MPQCPRCAAPAQSWRAAPDVCRHLSLGRFSSRHTPCAVPVGGASVVGLATKKIRVRENNKNARGCQSFSLKNAGESERTSRRFSGPGRQIARSCVRGGLETPGGNPYTEFSVDTSFRRRHVRNGNSGRPQFLLAQAALLHRNIPPTRLPGGAFLVQHFGARRHREV